MGQNKDLVCDMTVSSGYEYFYDYAGNQYLFCSEHCLQKLKEHPRKYPDKKIFSLCDTGGKSDAYTCPMHPKVIQDLPGSCLKCGMALEPVTSGGEEKTRN